MLMSSSQNLACCRRTVSYSCSFPQTSGGSRLMVSRLSGQKRFRRRWTWMGEEGQLTRSMVVSGGRMVRGTVGVWTRGGARYGFAGGAHGAWKTKGAGYGMCRRCAGENCQTRQNIIARIAILAPLFLAGFSVPGLTLFPVAAKVLLLNIRNWVKIHEHLWQASLSMRRQLPTQVRVQTPRLRCLADLWGMAVLPKQNVHTLTN